jgi:hypothetical protein
MGQENNPLQAKNFFFSEKYRKKVEKTAIHGIYQNKIMNQLIFNPWIALKRKIALYMHVPNFKFKYGAN